MEDEGEDDMTPAGHLAKSLRHPVEEDGSPLGSPNTIDSVETPTEDPAVKQPVNFSRSKKISEDSNAQCMVMMSRHSNLMQELKGTVDCWWPR